METINLANVLLILGVTYLGMTYGWEWYLIVFIAGAILSWGYYGLSNERKEHIKSEIKLLDAKTNYYRRRK